ncbi:uncharacterized protein LOC143450524 [Clavelina lepadiformis]|uniref:Sushi domain-containing protein n=1 Tax=Clavelina lepadiformis TaxID=159417 RepID=A0ABP0H3Y4_CLALP
MTYIALLTLAGFLLIAPHQGSLTPLDPRCPPVTGYGICEVCPSEGCECEKMCCRNGCGSSCIPVPSLPPELSCLQRIRCRGLTDCDPVRDCPGVPGARCTLNCNCGKSFLGCDGRLVTDEQCRHGPYPKCSSPTDGPVVFHVTCTNGYQAGSFCTARCPPGHVLRGVSKIVCGKIGDWDPGDFRGNRCIKTPNLRPICLPGTPGCSSTRDAIEK